jgi:hypothetical protein
MPKNKGEDLFEFYARQLQRVRDKRSGLLFMSDWELTEIPEEVFELNDVKLIFLDGNQLRRLPERLWDLPIEQPADLRVNV